MHNADPSRCAIMGASAGGYAVLMALSSSPDTWAAGINVCGVTDLFALDRDTHLLERHYNVQLEGPLPDSFGKYYTRSPIFSAERIVAPLLIFQGAKDTVVTKYQSTELIKKIKGISHYVEYPMEGHVFNSYDNWADFYRKTDEFLLKHVLLGPKFKASLGL